MKLMEKVKNFAFFMKLSWKMSPHRFPTAILDSLFSVARKLIYVFFPKYVIDALVEGKTWREVLTIIAIFIGSVAAVKLSSLLARSWINASINLCNIDAFKHYMNMASHTKYAITETASYQDKLQMALGRVRGAFGADFCASLVSTLVSLIIYTTYIVGLSPIILAVVLVVAVVNIFVKSRLNRLEDETLADFKKNIREFDYIHDTFAGFDYAKEVRINQTEGLYEEKHQKNLLRRWQLNTSYGRKQMGLRANTHVANAAQLVVVYGYAGYLAWNGAITLGALTAYAASVINFSDAISSVIEAFSALDYTVRYIPAYKELVALTQEPDDVLTDLEIKRPIEIKFEDVSFAYPNTERQVLNHLNLTLTDGCKLAIVGENGAGKTTFIKLLCRLYSPTSGRITINGIDIEKIPREVYARLLSVVFQDFKLFSFDVADNIVLNAEPDDKKLNSVIDRADLRGKIDSLDDGVHTFINREFDEHGVEFSGGEAQKLALARAYYKGSPVVILDEPTSALDPKAEIYLYNHFQSIIDGKSAIFISHRLASTAFCDRIAVFSDGQVAELGTHQELLQLNGIYAQMWGIQAELYAQKGEAK